MKKFFTLIALLAATAGTTLSAQCVKVYPKDSRVAITYPLASLGDITFQGGSSVNLGNATFTTSTIDSIVVDRTAQALSHTVQVAFNDQKGAFLTISGDVNANLTNIQVKGNHVSIDQNPAMTDEVSYILSGSTTNGSFYTSGKYKAALTLNGVSITNPDSAAIYVDNGKRIDVIMPEGTVNTLVDGATGTQKACFFINGHAEFKGAGVLNLTGNARHAYASDEYTLFKASTGTINVLASANDGLHIEQYFQMDGGTVNIPNVKGDCIDVSCTKDVTDEYNGQVFINAGTLKYAVTGEDVKGLKSEADMTIRGGNIEATVSGNGGKGISVGGNLVIDQAAGATTNIKMDVSGTTYKDPNDATNTSKCRGIKVKGNYTLKGGTIYMNVTGKKAKGISCDGQYIYTGGTTNVLPE